MRKGLIVLAVLGSVLLAAPAIAQAEEIVITIDQTTRGSPGSEHVVAELTIPESLIGAVCGGTATTGNNASEHPNNDFIIGTGGTSGVIADWEATAGASVSMSGTVTLGDTLTVTLRLGADGVSSGGVIIVLSCAQPEPPTTTTTTTTTTQPPDPETTTTTQPPDPGTTTTEAPPEGGVQAGGGITGGGSSPAAPWVGGGALLLATGLALIAFGRRIVSKGD